MPETTNLFNCGDNKIKKFNTSQIIWRKHVWSVILRLSLRYIAIKNYFLKNVILLKRHFYIMDFDRDLL